MSYHAVFAFDKVIGEKSAEAHLTLQIDVQLSERQACA
jgi:hypothetical protein